MKVKNDTVGRDVGRIIQAVSLMMLISLVVAAVNGEFYTVPAFVVSAVIMAGIGTALVRRYRGADPPEKREAMVTAATAWALVGILGGLPFVLIAWTIHVDPFPAWANTPPMDPTTATFRHPLNAVFESMSGFTGTGLTMATVEEELPRAIHWWRSFIEWVGGVGVIVLTVAILRRSGGSSGSYTLYESEARSEKIHPSIVTTVREIWKIFLGLTLGSIALFLLAGMPLWDAINHGMTGIATGGFSVHADSIGHYGSPLIEYATVPIMVAGSIAFPIHYLIFKGELRNFYADLQTRWVFIWFGAGSLVLTAILYANGQYPTLEETFRVSLFQFVSATSNTGFGSASVGNGTERVWTAGPTLFACLGMLTGAAAGSTVSGIKLIRVVTLVKGTVWQIQDVFRPQAAIRYLQIGDRRLSEAQAQREYTEATVVFLLWITFLVIGVAVLLRVLPPTYPLEYVIFDVMSAQSNVGLDSGVTGATMPGTAKAMLIINMWVGRLEIIPVAVLIGSVVRRLDRSA
ncbi:potassium transporter Trk [Halorubrum ezzemoulense DSM 17463]|uniref:Potassium transporter Trk n=1 Tax=Halorubrum ezzemoulense DSM 17463 TaxID=1121945 RepID=A0A1X4H376_HALEZ|nr:TrkH family potassium uptake protein [Halorubrum ezzemoulense]OSP05072.1 potassium transporter Trk [Halorubrum ezzemoulense DSM 17463]